MLLSILICTIDSRKEEFTILKNHLEKQIKENNLVEKVEIIYCCDNKIYPVGLKRNALLKNASGKFLCFVDDDDWVSKDYVKLITDVIKENEDIDCIGIKGKLISLKTPQMNKEFIHSIKYKEYSENEKYYIRPINHLNPIKSEIAKKYIFPTINRCEDTDWAMKISKDNILKKEIFIDKIIYYYRFDFNTSETVEKI